MARLALLTFIAVTGCAAGGSLDSGAGARVDADTDAGSMMDIDAGSMMDTDAGSMMGIDAGPMMGTDAGYDAGTDAGFDAGFDAGHDAGWDAGWDAGTDAGPAMEVDYPVGGRTRSWTASRYFRGNSYEAYTTTTLLRFSAYLGLSGSCTLGFYVFTSSSATGPFTRIWSNSVTSSGTGFHSSGPIDLVATSGTFYTLGVGWDCSATYYSANYDTMTGLDGGIGYLRGNVWSNSYSGYTTGFVPSGSAAGGAHYEQIVTIMR